MQQTKTKHRNTGIQTTTNQNTNTDNNTIKHTAKNTDRRTFTTMPLLIINI